MNKLFFASCAAFVYKWEPRYIWQISSPSMILLWRQFSVTEVWRENVQRGAAELAELTPSPVEKEGECWSRGGALIILICSCCRRCWSADCWGIHVFPHITCRSGGIVTLATYICLTFLRCARIHASCRCKVCRCYILDLGAEDHFILFLDKSSGALNVMGGDRRRFCKIPKPVQLSFGGTFPTLRRELAKHCAHCENIHFPHCTLLIVLSSL